MKPDVLDVIIVGAGHAGLTMSYFLSKHQLRHLVFEQGNIGDSWMLQRWDSFRLNSCNQFNSLPGFTFFQDPEAFCSAPEFVFYLQAYASKFKLPVKAYCPVLKIERDAASHLFTITTSGQATNNVYQSRQVVIASGGQNKPLIPPFTNKIDHSIIQLHTSQYRNAALLPPGAVLVVGSAQSGTQIADDLLQWGKPVFLATCKVGRIPRRYRNKDIFEWLFPLGLYDVKHDDISDPQVFRMKPPQVSGVGLRGCTSSLQSLARKGAVILGTATDASADVIFLLPNASEHVQFADAYSQRIKTQIEDYIAANNIAASPQEEDSYDLPDEGSTCASGITALNLQDNNISAIIWTTGFTGNFDYIQLPAFSDDGSPKHHNGCADIEGFYFVGLPWLRRRKSGIIWGTTEDTAFICEQILNFKKTQ